jgi:hypothetical protein
VGIAIGRVLSTNTGAGTYEVLLSIRMPGSSISDTDFIVGGASPSFPNALEAIAGNGIVISKASPFMVWSVDTTHVATQAGNNDFDGNNKVGLGVDYLSVSIPNASSGGGTVISRLVKLAGAPSAATMATVGDGEGIIGVCMANCGATGFARVAIRGRATCEFDGPTDAGDWVTVSSSEDGKCTDAGLNEPATDVVIGRVLSTNASAGEFEILLDGRMAQKREALLSVKGDLHGFSSADTRISVGVDSEVLIADSTADAGVAWKKIQSPVESWYPAVAYQSGTPQLATGWSTPDTDGALAEGGSAGGYGYGYLAFQDGSVPVYANLAHLLPEAWDGGSVEAVLTWSAEAGTGTSARWRIGSACLADGGSITNPSFGPETGYTDTVPAAGTRTQTTWADAGSAGCNAGDTLLLQLSRDPADAGDDFSGDLLVTGLSLRQRTILEQE